MTKYQIKLRLKLGRMVLYINNQAPPRGICKNCKQEIFWIKILGSAKIQATHLKNNEYIDHSLCCPTVLAFEDRMRSKNFKKHKK